MANLLDDAIEAHGGLQRWRQIRKIDLRLNFSGAMVERKGLPRHLQPSCTIDVRQCQVSFDTLTGVAGDRWVFSPDWVWGEKPGGAIEERRDPVVSFAGHSLETKWDQLHFTYFLGYALWNYLTTPFLFVSPGFAAREIESHQEDGERWRVLEVTYPDSIPTHSKVQRLYFGSDFHLRRLDYRVDIIPGAAAHYCFDHKSLDGIVIPMLRRVVQRTEDGPKRNGPTLFLLDYTDVALRS